uniref:Uncharacterized protein n=1 Tax=Oryza glaberrima TaxID=4538 RepID=I1QPV4_ORYGL
AVRAAARDISTAAVVWALTHVVQHGDTILLLAVMLLPHRSGKKFWEFPLFAGGCASGHRSVLIQNSDVAYLCNQMMLKLRDFYDPSKVQKGALLCFFSSIFQHKHKHNKSTMAVVGDGGAVAVIERRRLGLFWTGEGRRG